MWYASINNEKGVLMENIDIAIADIIGAIKYIKDNSEDVSIEQRKRLIEICNRFLTYLVEDEND